MRSTFWPSLAILLASLANAVPSQAALHPAAARCGLKEADITGSGFEVPHDRVTCGHSGSDRPDAKIIREWRAMAARCRSLAAWQNDGGREALIKLAEEYEARATRVEGRLKG
jgi:hypothetical protein